MFQGFTDETFEFFMAIAFNNNTDFFHANHDWYLRAVREPCLQLAAALSDAVEAVDDCVGQVVDATLKMGGVCFITADHGNADMMIGPDDKPFTPHTTNPVPFCMVGREGELKSGGRLADICPTMLKVMGLPQPAEMTGECLIK